LLLLKVRRPQCVLWDDIWIRAVFIMNIHNAVALRSDVAHLRDGTSCLREVVESLRKGSLNQSAQRSLKRKLQVLVDAQTAITNDLQHCKRSTQVTQLLHATVVAKNSWSLNRLNSWLR
jgi:hypothetical protein